MIWRKELQNIYSYSNVQLVNELLTQEDWNFLFPLDDNNAYETFLTAIAQFPAFCSEFRDDGQWPNLQTQEKACKRELATLFAHIIFNTGKKDNMNSPYERTGFQYRREQDCVNEPIPDRCKYHDSKTLISEYFPANENRDYFGRGPMHLRWST